MRSVGANLCCKVANQCGSLRYNLDTLLLLQCTYVSKMAWWWRWRTLSGYVQSVPRHVALCRHGKIGNPCTGVLGPKCDTSTHAKGLMTGHYTAASWAGSSEIGCGYRVCKNECFKDVPRILIGCQYFPGISYDRTHLEHPCPHKIHVLHTRCMCIQETLP